MTIFLSVDSKLSLGCSLLSVTLGIPGTPNPFGGKFLMEEKETILFLLRRRERVSLCEEVEAGESSDATGTATALLASSFTPPSSKTNGLGNSLIEAKEGGRRLDRLLEGLGNAFTRPPGVLREISESEVPWSTLPLSSASVPASVGISKIEEKDGARRLLRRRDGLATSFIGGGLCCAFFAATAAASLEAAAPTGCFPSLGTMTGRSLTAAMVTRRFDPVASVGVLMEIDFTLRSLG